MFKRMIPVILLVLVSACAQVQGTSGTATGCPHCAQCACCQSGSCQCAGAGECACCKGGMCPAKMSHHSGHASSVEKAGEACPICAKAKADAAHKGINH